MSLVFYHASCRRVRVSLKEMWLVGGSVLLVFVWCGCVGGWVGRWAVGGRVSFALVSWVPLFPVSVGWFGFFPCRFPLPDVVDRCYLGR